MLHSLMYFICRLLKQLSWFMKSTSQFTLSNHAATLLLSLPFPLPTPTMELGVESTKGERSQANNNFLETAKR